MNKRKITLFIGLVLFISLIPTVVYIYHFCNSEISNNVNDWADFATYFSGITTPILTFSNLLILIWITKEVAKLDSDRKNQEFNFQEKLTGISNKLQKEIAKETNKVQLKSIKSQLQFEQFCKLSDKLDLIGINLFKIENPTITIILVLEYIKEFTLEMEELIPILKDTSNVQKMEKMLEDLKSNFIAYSKSKSDTKLIEKINSILNNFQFEKLIYLRKIQRFILEDFK